MHRPGGECPPHSSCSGLRAPSDSSSGRSQHSVRASFRSLRVGAAEAPPGLSASRYCRRWSTCGWFHSTFCRCCWRSKRGFRRITSQCPTIKVENKTYARWVVPYSIFTLFVCSPRHINDVDKNMSMTKIIEKLQQICSVTTSAYLVT